MENAGTDLATVIESLRVEMMKARAKGRGQRMQLRVDSIDLTLEVQASQERKGELKWNVLLEGGGAYGRSSVRTQTLTLHLTPEWHVPGGGGGRLGNEEGITESAQPASLKKEPVYVRPIWPGLPHG